MQSVRPPTAVSRRAPIAALVALTCLVGTAARAHAQDPWDAILMVTPFPSPYLSDWETNPTIASLTVINSGSQAQDVILYSEVRNQAGAVITVGRSDPQTIPPGVPVVYNDLTQIAGTQEHDQATEDLVRRSGRLPEGEYEACVAVTNLSGFVLAQACMDFTIVYPDPPMLIAPADGDMVSSAAPILQWTPLQVPPDYSLQYVLQIAEVLPNQLPEAALSSNILHYENLDVGTTSLSYPVDGLPLESGKTYAWRVVAMDQNGYAAATNGGSSEIWSFGYEDGTGGSGETPATTVQLVVLNTQDGDAPAEPTENEALLGFLCRDTGSGTSSFTYTAGVSSPYAFLPRMVTQAAVYRHQTSAGERSWALEGQFDGRNGRAWQVMAFGDCPGATDLGALRWIGIRRAGMNDPCFFEEDALDSAGLESCILVFTPFELDVAAPNGFTAVDDFLNSRELDARPGLNVLAVWKLQERAFWPFFQALGYTEKEIVLQGFVGVNNTLSFGFTRTAEGGGKADLSVEQEFLNFRAALPTREPPSVLGRLFKSMHLELELALKDTIQVTGRDDGSAQLHLLLNVNHHIELTDAVVNALRLDPGAELVSTLGLDLSKEVELKDGKLDPDAAEAKLVNKYALDATWSWGKLVFGNLELELGVMLAGKEENGLSKAGEFMMTLSASAGWGAQDALGKLALTLGKKPTPKVLQSIDKMNADIARWKDLIEFTRGQFAELTTAADSAKYQGYIDRYEGWIAETQSSLSTVEGLNATKKLQERVAAVRPPGCSIFGKQILEDWYCQARLSLGNMSLVDFLALIREAVGAAAGGDR